MVYQLQQQVANIKETTEKLVSESMETCVCQQHVTQLLEQLSQIQQMKEWVRDCQEVWCNAHNILCIITSIGIWLTRFKFKKRTFNLVLTVTLLIIVQLSTVTQEEIKSSEKDVFPTAGRKNTVITPFSTTGNANVA